MTEVSITPSRHGVVRLTADEKHERYDVAVAEIGALLESEADLLACMSSVVGVLHNTFPYFSWTGFYRRAGSAELVLGPYQGTVGCLRIPFSRGVCGFAAREGRTIVVPDVHRFPGHIACDPRSRSEIVVPVFDDGGVLIAVLDVDSTLEAAFDEADRAGLERAARMLTHRSNEVVWRTTPRSDAE